MKPRPLNQDLANPCMKCGSVQCSYCGIDVASAVAWLKEKMLRFKELINQPYRKELTDEEQQDLGHILWIISKFERFVDEAFAGVKGK